MPLRLLASEKFIPLLECVRYPVFDAKRGSERHDFAPVEGNSRDQDRVLLVQGLAHRAANPAGRRTEGIVIQTHANPGVDVPGLTCRRSSERLAR